MNKLFKLTVAVLIPFLSLSGEGLKRGVDVVAQAIEAYSSENVRDFLKELDNEYFEKRSSHELDWLLDLRKERSHLAGQKLAKHDVKREKRRDYAIRKVVSHSKEEIARGLKEALSFTLSKEEQEALDILTTINRKFLEQGESPLENRLIAIDIEFDLKRQMLDTKYSQNKDVDLEKYQDEQLYLEIDKLERMLKACTQDSDTPLAKKVMLALKLRPKMLAIQLEKGNLQAIGSKHFTPKTRLEKELQAIMKEYTK